MNCKQGDLCRIVGHPNAVGALVITQRLLTQAEAQEENNVYWPAWSCTALCHIEAQMNGVVRPGHEVLCADRCLRPIRPSDAPDETMSWKDVPQETPTHRELTKARA